MEETQANRYLDALKKEIMRYSDTNYVKSSSFASIYIGGGTPTSLRTEQLTDLLAFLNEQFKIRSDAE
ncbi:MAG: coproporphyrinogen III oxidase family protein, partial [Euryarchaeota archaeon]|nr:coproporphyrinogen III oxidase family protein [Euryarchaeota archaeon]